LKSYLEAIELKLAAGGYLKKGTLTVFSGIPFSPEEPYNYREAKRVVRLATEALRQRDSLQRELQIDESAKGRTKILGTSGDSVWDFLAFKQARDLEKVTSAPHWTLSIQRAQLWTALVIPNALQPSWRVGLRRMNEQEFGALLHGVTKSITRDLRTHVKIT
jgi:hypothetical protein